MRICPSPSSYPSPPFDPLIYFRPSHPTKCFLTSPPSSPFLLHFGITRSLSSIHLHHFRSVTHILTHPSDREGVATRELARLYRDVGLVDKAAECYYHHLLLTGGEALVSAVQRVIQGAYLVCVVLCPVSYCTALYHTLLYCILLYCTVLCCTAKWEEKKVCNQFGRHLARQLSPASYTSSMTCRHHIGHIDPSNKSMSAFEECSYHDTTR